MDAKHSIDMTEGPLLPQIITFALPLMASALLQMAFNTADFIVVGRFCGHAALAAIGARLNGISGRNTMTYRVGGDEFVALFMRQDEETVRQKLQRVREEIEGLGISVSAGYAMRTEDRYLEEVLHESDRNMYKNKTEYYRKKGIDRRRQADNR